MSDPRTNDDMLHAWVDGRLSPEEAQAMQARAGADPALADDARAWREQRELLRSHLAPLAQAPLPPELLRMTTRRGSASRAWRWGAMAASLFLAFGAGWFGQMLAQGQGMQLASRGRPAAEFARQALVAYTVYAPEVRHPVEVDAAQQEHLVQWLSRRLGRPLRVPQLSGQGFELVGGRLLPGDKGARAQFMYQNAAGERVTLYVGALPSASASASAQETAFRFAREGRASSFYWVDQGFGYALAGELPRERLLAVADAVYKQL